MRPGRDRRAPRAITSVIRAQRSLLDALGQAHDRGTGPRRAARASASTARSPCDGTRARRTSAPAHASSSDAVACSAAGQRDAGQVVGVLVSVVDLRRELGAPRPQRGRRRSGRRSPPPPCPTIRRRRPRPASRRSPVRARRLRDRATTTRRRPARAAAGRSRAPARRTRRSRPSAGRCVCFTCSPGAEHDRLADHGGLRDPPLPSAACGPSSGSGAFPTARPA